MAALFPYISQSTFQLAGDVLAGHTDGNSEGRELWLAETPWKQHSEGFLPGKVKRTLGSW